MVGFLKTFSGVLDAWILHNSDQNFIFPVIVTRCIDDIANQLLTSLTFRVTQSGWWMNTGAFNILNPRSFVGIFSDYGCQNTEKSVLLTESDVQTFLEGEENQNTERKTESCVFSCLSNGISRGWERKSTTGIFVTSRFWPCTWKISSVGKAKSITKNFTYWKLDPLFVFVVFQLISFFFFFFFILRLSAQALYDFYSGIVNPFIFIR